MWINNTVICLNITQFSSVAQLCPTLRDPMNHSTPGFPVHHQLPESTQTHVHWVGDAIQPSHPPCPLLLLPSIFPRIRVFSNESSLCMRLPKYWSFIFNIRPSNEYPGLISFRMDWLDLLAVTGTWKEGTTLFILLFKSSISLFFNMVCHRLMEINSSLWQLVLFSVYFPLFLLWI